MTKPSKYTIIRDTKEQLGWDFATTDVCEGVIDYKLSTGDYSLLGHETTVAIERKRNVAEVAMNINEERFPRFIERLSKYKHKYIICEFSIEDVMRWPEDSGLPRDVVDKIRVSAKYILMRLTEYMVKHDIKVIFAGDRGNAAKIASSIFKRIVEHECTSKTYRRNS